VKGGERERRRKYKKEEDKSKDNARPSPLSLKITKGNNRGIKEMAYTQCNRAD